MNLSAGRLFVAINALVGLVVGASLLVVPSTILAILGIEVDPSGSALAQLYGAELVGFNVATWMYRHPPFVRPIVIGHVVNESLTATVLVLGAIGGLGNAFVWLFAVVAATFAIGFGWLAIQPSGASE